MQLRLFITYFTFVILFYAKYLHVHLAVFVVAHRITVIRPMCIYLRVTTFSDCSTRDMFDYIIPTINRKPDQLIVHAGANSLRDRPNPTECAGEIIDLANSIRDSLRTTELVLSALITRSDDVERERQVDEVNKILRQHCDKKRWNILEHSSITKRHLNRSGLHLNKVGTTHLACNLIQCIQHGST